MTFEFARTRMIEEHLEACGITQRRVLDAFRRVPREAFLADELVQFAYDDTPLPIGEGQTISQPYIVAVTVEGLECTAPSVCSRSARARATPHLAELALEVYNIERLSRLAQDARERLARLGYRNVHVLEGDGSLGVPRRAPFDAIAAAGAPRVPAALREQLAPGGRLVIPARTSKGRQVLLRITRTGDTYHEERLTSVRFVPLVGEQGYADAKQVVQPGVTRNGAHGLAALIRECAEPALSSSAVSSSAASSSAVSSLGSNPNDIGAAAIDALIERIADSRVVLLGEATHGTSEFHRTGAEITRALIDRRRLSARQGARQPLFQRESAAAVRRVRLDRRDARGRPSAAARHGKRRRLPRDIPVWRLNDTPGGAGARRAGLRIDATIERRTGVRVALGSRGSIGRFRPETSRRNPLLSARAAPGFSLCRVPHRVGFDAALTAQRGAANPARTWGTRYWAQHDAGCSSKPRDDSPCGSRHEACTGSTTSGRTGGGR